MIARLWRGLTRTDQAEDYLDYLRVTGLQALQGTEGNQGVLILRRETKDAAEFILISLWDSIDSIQSYAGAKVELAAYFPEDERFLLELEPFVMHFQVVEKANLDRFSNT
jgi:heme-degrading monooxygenase HmoA